MGHFLAAHEHGGSVARFFNGRIEAPALTVDGVVVERWNFADEMTSMRVPSALGAAGQELCLVNAPIRAVRCGLWDASEMCWRHKPQHYAAIHFNEDAIFDFDWETSFSFELPKSMPSGVYVMRISSGKHEDAMPFFVCPPKGTQAAKLCVLVSTFTYTIYGNHARRIIRHLGRIALSPMEPIPIIQRPIPNMDYPPTTFFLMERHLSCLVQKATF